MKFIADLHVHSKYSIATAKNLDLENLYIAAQKKGITVVGTGDFTHPGWMAELKEKLIESEPGLFRLKKEIEKECDQQVPPTCRQPVRFLLTTEISNIYKKNDKTRKNHNLILAPDLRMAEKFNVALDRIGNIKSDGRPILGLDARNLLEMLLGVSDQAIFIPAHIWTPWFSLLGSKSGFDTVEECFEDLSKYIFAVETGLSSDPAMNWRVSGLDRMTLISNSDAHSPMKLGREANLFNTELSYDAIRTALMTGNPELFQGTLEFFPEEGKYHLDGHRKCGVRFTPEQTLQNKGICPVCGKPMTIGVLYRVEALADQETGRRSPNAHPYQRVVPLVDILSQVLSVGVNTKKVQSAYQATVSALGNEFSILTRHPIETIEKKTNIPLLGEAIRRMRAGRVEVNGGYDGEFGTIRIFRENEKSRLMGQKSLFSDESDVKKPIQKKTYSDSSTKVSIKKTKIPISGPAEGDWLKNAQPKTINGADMKSLLNPAQRQVIDHGDLPLIIAAGPGTGKTMTITGRMAHLIKKKKVSPRQILAVTFTNKAAEEMHSRLKRQLPQSKNLPTVTTFHAFCLDLLSKRHPENPPTVIDETDRDELLADAISVVSKRTSKNDHSIVLKSETIRRMIMTAKQKIQTVEEIDTGRGKGVDRQVRAVSAAYHNMLAVLGVYDYEDLIFKTVKYLESGKQDDPFGRPWFRYIFIDEYQDINEGQYRLIRAIVPEGGIGLCVIGDPDQSIYGFRGSDVRFFQQFLRDFPKAKRINFNQSYRSVETILKASFQVIRSANPATTRNEQHLFSGIKGVQTIDVCECATERAEAATIGRRIVEMIGGRGYHDLDLGRAGGGLNTGERGFGDIAVLYRTGRQGDVFTDVFEKMGIPCQMVQRRRRYPYRKVRQFISLLTILEGKPLYGDLETVRDVFRESPTRKTIKIFRQWGLENDLCLNKALRKARFVLIDNITRPQQRRLEGMIRQINKLKNELNPLDVANKLATLVEWLDIRSDNEKEPGLGEVVNQIIQGAGKQNHRTAGFLSSLALQSDADTFMQNAQNVALMTMHAAKGLEFPVVFIAGCEDGLIPFHPIPLHEAGGRNSDIEEERRLFYVAMTRAKEALFLAWAKKRRIYGKSVSREVSPFIRTIETSLLDKKRISIKRKKPEYVQMSLFH